MPDKKGGLSRTKKNSRRIWRTYLAGLILLPACIFFGDKLLWHIDATRHNLKGAYSILLPKRWKLTEQLGSGYRLYVIEDDKDRRLASIYAGPAPKFPVIGVGGIREQYSQGPLPVQHVYWEGEEFTGLVCGEWLLFRSALSPGAGAAEPQIFLHVIQEKCGPGAPDLGRVVRGIRSKETALE